MRLLLFIISLFFTQLSLSQKLSDNLYCSIIQSISGDKKNIYLQTENVNFPVYMSGCILEQVADLSEKTKLDSIEIKKILLEKVNSNSVYFALFENKLPDIIQFKCKNLNKIEKFNKKLGKRIWVNLKPRNISSEEQKIELYNAKARWIIRFSVPVFLSNNYFIIFTIFGENESTYVSTFILFKINSNGVNKICTYCWGQR